MTERARTAFEAYLRLGDDRTLAKVVKDYASHGDHVHLGTLKRWSRRYRWKGLLRELQRADAIRVLKNGIAAIGKPIDDLAVVRELKQRVIQHALLDSNEPAGSPQILAHSIRDLSMLIELERKLVASNNGSPDSEAAQPKFDLPIDVINAVGEEALRRRYGLPPPDLRPPDEK